MTFFTFPTAVSRFMTLCMGLTFGMLLAACGGGGSGTVGLPTGTALFTNAPASVTVAAGAKTDYTIGGGTPTYMAASSNRDVATATVSGTGLSITGVGAGSATITVTDATGTATAIGVTVSAPVVQSPSTLFSTAAGALTVPVGGSASYSIGGGRAPYAISSSNTSVASATINGSNFTVSGLGSGAARIVITDAAGIALDLVVTVGTGSATPLYSTSPNAISVKAGANSTYAIGGGRPGYSVSSSNPGVAQIGRNGNDFVVTGVAAGSAQIAIVDTGGATISIEVTVGTADTVTALFSTAPDNVVVGIGATAAYAIGGGKPGYAVTSSNAAVAKVAINGNAYIVTGLAPGTAQIRVSDSQGDSLAVGMTVGSGAPSTPVTFFTTAPTSASVEVGATESYTLSGGTAPYAVSSSNSAVARVVLTGTNYVITGISGGTAIITAFDTSGAAVATTVTVGAGGPGTELFTTAPAAVTIIAGDTATFAVAGGKAPYALSTANAAVAKIAITGNDFAITAIAAGSVQVRLVDANGAAVTIAVTVPAPPAGGALFTTAPDTVTIAAGTSAGYTVSGGTGTYSVTTGNAAVATASLSGGALTVNAIAAGTATIRISDSAGASDSIVVTVSQSSPSAIVVNPNAATGNVGDTLNFLVSGGTPGYTVTINNTTLATVAPSSVPTNGGGFAVTLRNVGTTTATIIDARGQVATLPITANQTTTTLRLSPSALVIGENYAGPVTLNIFGGTGPYTVFTSDESKSQVSVTGSVVTVNGVGPNGTRCIRPVNSEGTYVPFGTYDMIITTVDSQGASATSIITIKDNGDVIADASCA